ncbi:MAG: MBL fold metallo-hydrolase [Oscillospiraceae bacterium]|nr:MBL fold metallo-hydrolase [Oscillospiraceae bacterium]
MEKHSVKITVLGARGSVPVSGSSFSRYGGATTCALFCADGQYIVLDAGTGLMALPEEAMLAPSLPVLLTHAHVDHLLGFPLSPCAMRKGLALDIYGATRDGLDVRAQLETLMKPPLWPVGPGALPANIRFHELPHNMRIGDVDVGSMEGSHPGGVSLLRLDAFGKRVVFATDCTLEERLSSKLAEFARGCDLLLIDGQYLYEEWEERSGFGHSSWKYVADFAKSEGVPMVRIIHHDPFRTDDELDKEAEELRAMGHDFDFAKEGEVIEL